MNNLSRHIEYLLLRHDCVIVPGLGAFIATKSPARIDLERGIVVPPSRSVMFNQAVSVDDGLLANSFARKHHLSFEEARQVLFREVAILKATILADGSVSLGNTGTLMLGEENNLLFAPAMSASEANSLIGYAPVALLGSMSAESRQSDDAPACGNDTSAHSGKIRFGKRLGKVVAAVAMVSAIALAAVLNPFPADNREQRASVVPVEVLMPRKSVEPRKDSVATVAKEPKTVIAPALPSHYLIVATFNNGSEAEAYAASHSTDEYPLEAVASRKLTRVAVAASDNKDELRRRLNSEEIKSRFPNAWIWSR